MRKACLKRVLCYACCLSLILGVFAYRPAKAEAVFVSPLAALGASLIASVVVGTTATFFVESGAADDIGDAIDFLLEEYISVMDELTGYTPQDICEIVGNGASMLENGVVQLSSRAGGLTAGFINWLQKDNGLQPGVTSTLTFPTIEIVTTSGVLRLPVCISSDMNGPLPGYPIYHFYDSSVAVQFDSSNGSYFNIRRLNSGSIKTEFSDAIDDYSGSRSLTNPGGYYMQLVCDRSNFIYALFFSNNEVGSPVVGEVYCNKATAFGDDFSVAQKLALAPYTEFQEIPSDMPEGQVLSIGTGLSALSQDDPQAIANMLMSAIHAGTLSPSVTIEGQATDIPGTDTDDDTAIAVPGADADLLDWTKYIGQKVASIPKAIGQSVAEAVAAVFSPDPKLVNEITGAFSAKFGFVETLKRIGDDLFGMTAASEPPVVWIHLEDAEGRYEYGGTVKALDMSWYQRYKEDMDRILGGFLWVAYCWLLFKRAPDILSGAGMAAAESQYIDDHQMVSGQWIKVRRSKRL